MDTKGIFKKTVNILTLASFLLWNLATATPEGGAVVQGNATISQSGAQTTVNQTSQAAVINWNSFNTASHEAVQFNQPNSSAVALNRITNGLPTQFAGSLNANGQVWILNPAGVLFTNTAKIDVAGLLATTHNITDSNFMSGNYKFDLIPGSESSSIINNGLISAKDSGIVALVAPHVANNGLIQANLGKVSLSSGAAYTLDMYGDSLINFGSNAPINNGSVSNAGTVIANGGKVYMTANYAAGVLDNMISMTGTIQAKSVGVNKKGEIVLYASDAQQKKLAGVTKVSGKLDASDGGFIETSGEFLDIRSSAMINAGVGGSWLLDPWNITVVAGAGLSNNSGAPVFTSSGTSTIGADLIVGQLNAGTSVTLNTASGGGDVGDITISAPITQTINSGPVTLTLIADRNVNIDQQITLLTGGALTVTSANSNPAGLITMNAPGVLNFTIQTGGTQTYNGEILLNTLAPNGASVTLTTTDALADIILNDIVTVPNSATNWIQFILSAGHDVNINGDILFNPALCAVTTGCGGYLQVSAGNKINIDTPNIQGGSVGVAPPTSIVTSFAFYAPIVLFQDLTLEGHGRSVGYVFNTVDASVSGGAALNIANGIYIGLGGEVGATAPLSSITVGQPVFWLDIYSGATSFTTTGSQTYNTEFLFANYASSPWPLNITPGGPGYFNGPASQTITVGPGETATFFSTTTCIVACAAIKGTQSLNAAIDTNVSGGPFTINGNAVLNGNIIAFGGATSFPTGNFTVTGTTTLNGFGGSMTIVSKGQLFQGPVILNTPTSLNIASGSGGTSLTEFQSTVTGAQTLIFNNFPSTSGVARFASTSLIGTLAVPLISLTATSNTTTDFFGTTIFADQQFYQGNVRVNPGSSNFLNALTSMSFTGANFFSYLVSGGGDLTINGSAQAPGTVLFSTLFGVGGGSPLGNLTVTGTPALNGIDIASSISVQGTAVFNTPVTIENAGGIFFTATGSTLYWFKDVVNGSGALGGQGIQVVPSSFFGQAGAVRFDQNVGSTFPLYFLVTTGATYLGNPLSPITITTTDGQTYAQPFFNVFNATVVLKGNVTLLNTNSGDIEFGDSGYSFGAPGHISSDGVGPWNLVINNPVGAVQFHGTLGAIGPGVAPINNLTVTSNNAVNGIIINTDSFVTNGFQLFNNPVSIVKNPFFNVTLTSNNSDITFISTLDSPAMFSSPGASNASFQTPLGTVTFGGLVGVTSAFSGITVGGLAAVMNMADPGQIKVNNTQTYNSTTTTIANNTSFLFNGYANVNTVLISSGLSPDITFNAGLALNGTIGSVNPLEAINSVYVGGLSFAQPGGGTFSGNVITTLNQTYTAFQNGNSFQLLGDTQFATTSSLGTIDIKNPLTGPAGLTINDSSLTSNPGAVIFEGFFPSGMSFFTPALAFLTITGPTTITSNGIGTVGNQTYNDTLTVANPILESIGAGGVITFNGSVEGAGGSINVNVTPTGLVIFNAPVGPNPLTYLNFLGVSGPALINTSSMSVAVDMQFDGPVTLNAQPVTFTVRNLIFNGPVVGSGLVPDVLVHSDGSLFSHGDLTIGGGGSISNINTLHVEGNAFFGGNITTNSTAGLGQQYDGNVTLQGSGSVLTTLGGNIEFNVLGGNITGTDLTAIAGASGNVVFYNFVNNLDNLTVTVTAPGQIQINTSSIATNFNQTYTGPVVASVAPGFSSGSGNIIFNSPATTVDGGGLAFFAVAPNGTIQFDGPVGSIAPFSTFYVNAAAININTSQITTDAQQDYTGTTTVNTSTVITANNGDINFHSPVILNADANISALTGAMTFSDLLDGAANLIATSNGTLTFTGAVGSGAPLTTLNAISLNNNIFFSSTLGTTGSVVLNTPNGVIFLLGDSTVGSLDATAGPFGFPVVIGGFVTSTTDQNYHSIVQLNINVVMTAGGNVLFADGANGQGLTVLGTGLASTIQMNGVFNETNHLIINAPVINMNAITTSVTGGPQIYTSAAINLTGAVSLSDANNPAGLIQLNGPVNGPGSLTINLGDTTPGTVEFDGVVGGVGGSNPLSSMDITGSQININNLATSITTSGDQIYNASLMTINTASVFTGANITEATPVVLNADTTYNVTNNVTFNGTVDSGITPSSLTVLAGNIARFSDQVGVSAAVTTLVVTAPFINIAQAGLTGAIISTATQIYTGTVTLDTLSTMNFHGSTVEFVNDVVGMGIPVDVTVTGNMQLDPTGTIGNFGVQSLHVTGLSSIGGNVTTGIDQLYDGAVTLTGSNFISLTSNSGNVTFGSTLDGTLDLSVSATNGTVFFEDVVGATPLNSLYVTALMIDISQPLLATSISTVFSQGYFGDVTLNNLNSITFNTTPGNTVQFQRAVNSSPLPTDVIINANLYLDASTGSMGQGGILNSLEVKNIAYIGGNISTALDQTYESTVELLQNINGPGLIAGGNITFDGAVGSNGVPYSLNVSATGAVNFNNAPAPLTPLNNLYVFGAVINLNGSVIDTVGYQHYWGPVSLNTAASTLNAGTDLIFFSTLDGNANLIGVAGNILQFYAPVGSGSAVANLDLTASSINIATGYINTSGNQIYRSPVVLMTDVNSPGLVAGGDITFNSTVDAQFSGVESLVINATGNVEFDAAVGAGALLNNLDVTGAQIRIAAGEINTASDQLYRSPVLLLGNVDGPGLVAGANVTFDGTVDGAFNLTVNATNNINLNDIIGGSDPLNVLIFTSGNTITTAGNMKSVTTTGNQTYNASLMVIDADPVFTSPGTITENTPLVLNFDTFYVTGVDTIFNFTVDGPANLTVTPTGTAIFSGDVGTTIPLESLTVNGTTTFNQGSLQTVRTNDSQIYTNTVTLLNDVELFTLDPGPFGTHLVSFGYGAAGVSGPSYSLTVVTNNPANGPSGFGIQGTVDVATFIMGGTGGGDISPITVDSFVAGQGGNTAWTNTLIILGATGYYCVNAACTPPVPPVPVINFPPNIPPIEIFNIPTPVTCVDGVCNNLEVMIDNLVEAGVVSCAGIGGCPFGFVQAEDTNGVVRILLPGDIVYVGDKILKEKDSCVCIKSLYHEKKLCAGPKERDLAYYK